MYAPQSQLFNLHIKKLITAAKLTQRIYGMSRMPDVLETFMKFIIVNNMKIQRMEISISPARGDLMPKNATDQRILRTNWTPNNERAVFTC